MRTIPEASRRTGRVWTAAVAALLGLVVVGASSPASAQGPPPSSPGPVPTADDAVVVGRNASGRAARAEDTSDQGYDAFDGVLGNVGSYTLNLETSPMVEEIRANVQTVADRLEAITGGTFAVAPGTIAPRPQDEVGRGEIDLVISDGPCQAFAAGCGSVNVEEAYPGTSIVTSGKVWIAPASVAEIVDPEPGFDPEPAQTGLVGHELGHALGLDHFDGLYRGMGQLMTGNGLVFDDYQAGDANGLLALHDGGARYLATLQPFTSYRTFLDRQAFVFPGRGPTGDERVLFGVALQGGQLTADDVINLYAQQPASIEAVGQLTRLYESFFERSPDTSGLTFWMGALRQGRSLASIAQRFAASPEFQARYGSLTDVAFVRRAYLNVLDRPGEESGVAFWTEQVRTGRRTRGQVMARFSASPELRAKTAAEVQVTRVFLGLLLRAPSPAEYAADAAALEDGSLTLVGLIEQLRTSPEYADLIG